ncbi:hypothetical protein JAAARDRAFT_501282 [Jaapia argillacea MUCL 33604]|uniref:Uncharacterized protein n=1 Tax=Jaapia argillacea MUCL 33604 TaxID=933084 RepID=A0A067P9R0_9AGAM|nr:hypothetical protein JAAARDRAFT_501282 [Jaapia argillacea MUCL 33604]
MTPLTAIHGGSGSAFPPSSGIPSTNRTRVNTPSISHPNLLSTLSSSFPSSHHPPSSSSHPSTQAPPSPRQTKSEVSYSSARGSTPYVPLKSHSSKWEFPLNVVVEMGMGKEGELEGCRCCTSPRL